MIGRGGWLRVPEETLRAAGIGERAAVRLGQGRGRAPSGRRARRASVERARDTRGPAWSASSRPAASRADTAPRRRSSELDATFAPGTLTAVTGPSGSGQVDAARAARGARHARTKERSSSTAVALSALDRDERAAFRAATHRRRRPDTGPLGRADARRERRARARPARPGRPRRTRAGARGARGRRARRPRRAVPSTGSRPASESGSPLARAIAGRPSGARRRRADGTPRQRHDARDRRPPRGPRARSTGRP